MQEVAAARVLPFRDRAPAQEDTEHPTLGHRPTASVVLFVGGLVFTVVMLSVLGCGFYGACSK